MQKDKLRILIAAGGTGGHVFPAIAIADEIKKLNPNTEFLFVGTKGKIEARVVPQRGYTLANIWISGFYRSLRFENLLFPVKVVVSLFQSFILIKKFQAGRCDRNRRLCLRAGYIYRIGTWNSDCCS